MHWVVVRPGGQTRILLARAQDAGVSNPVGSQSGFYLQVDDFDAMYDKMISEGIEFLTEPRIEAHGWVAHFKAVSGNMWE